MIEEAVEKQIKGEMFDMEVSPSLFIPFIKSVIEMEKDGVFTKRLACEIIVHQVRQFFKVKG